MLRITAIQLHQLFCISLLIVCLIPCRSLFDCWCSLREREQESRAHVCAWGRRVGRCLNSWMKVVCSCRFLLYWALEDRPWAFSTLSELCFWKDAGKAMSNTCNSYVILHPHWGCFTPKNASKNLQTDFESKEIWALQSKYQFWTELNHCFFKNIYFNRENLIYSSWPSL